MKSSSVGAFFILVLGCGVALAQPGAIPVPPQVAASPQFRPLTDADVQQSLAQVRTAAAELDARFATAGDSAGSWKEYLDWNKFQVELQKAAPDLGVMQEAYNNLAAGYDGLELKWFANLRTALREYVAVSNGIRDPALPATFQGHVDGLQQSLKTLGPNPSTEEAQKLNDHLAWLSLHHQAPELVREVRDRFGRPNVHVQFGAELLGIGVGGPVDEVAPIEDVILGTHIHGTGRTVGMTRAQLTPNPDFAAFDAVLEAVNHSNNIGRNGPVCIYTRGETSLAACKRFWMDSDGIHAMSAVANARTCTTIDDIVSIKGRQMVEKIAWRRAGKQKSLAEAIASEHAACRLRDRVNAQADPSVAQANERYQTKVRKPLDERRLFPQSLAFSTLATALEIRGVGAMDAQLAAGSAPPELAQPADISVRVHETMVNNLAENVLTGMRLNDEMVQRTSQELLGRIPEQLKPDQEPFTVIFPKEQAPRVPPVSVTFGDSGFTVTLRGAAYYTGDRRQPGMYVTAAYKFVKGPAGYMAVRQGDLSIYGFGQKPGAPRSLRQQGIYVALQRKFGKIFDKEIALKGFKFAEGKLATAGQLNPQEIIAKDGWLVIGYARSKSGT